MNGFIGTTRNTFVLLICAITVFSWASGCGKASDKGLLVGISISRGSNGDSSAATAGDSASASASPSASPSPTASASPLPAELVGTWTSVCDGNNTSYNKFQYVFNANSGFTKVQQNFSDSSCASLTSSYTSTGTLSLGEAVGSGPRNIDLMGTHGSGYGVFELLGDVLFLSDTASSSSSRITSITNNTPLFKTGGSVDPYTAANLAGTWSTTDCYMGAGGKYYTDRYVIALNGTFTYTYNIYNNDTCTTPADTPSGIASGTFTLENYTFGSRSRNMTVSILPPDALYVAGTMYTRFELAGTLVLWFSIPQVSTDARTTQGDVINKNITYFKQ